MSPAGRLIAIARATPSSESRTEGLCTSMSAVFRSQKSMGATLPIRSAPMRIDGSGALVVGGASGLGEATARALAERGASVVVADVNEEKGEALAGEIGARFVKADVTNEDEVQAAVAAAAEADGGLRIGGNRSEER